MKIIKVINNNTVCALDKKGKEQIISGKGIGFGKKRGDEVDSAQIQKIYMIADSALRKRMVECLAEIPYEHIRLTSDLVDHISEQFSQEVLKESLMISLSDHISFAIERQKQGINFANPLMDSHSRLFSGGTCSRELLSGRNPPAAGNIASQRRSRLHCHAYHQRTAAYQHGTSSGYYKAGEWLCRNCRYFLSRKAGQDHRFLRTVSGTSEVSGEAAVPVAGILQCA